MHQPVSAEAEIDFMQNIKLQNSSGNPKVLASSTFSNDNEPSTSLQPEGIALNELSGISSSDIERPLVANKSQSDSNRQDIASTFRGSRRYFKQHTRNQIGRDSTNMQAENLQYTNNYNHYCCQSKWTIVLLVSVAIVVFLSIIFFVIWLLTKDSNSTIGNHVVSHSENRQTTHVDESRIIMTNAEEQLKIFYETIFLNDNPISIPTVGYNVHEKWVNVTIRANGKKTTDYASLIVRIFDTEGKDIFVMEGAAGFGKTMLMRKIAHDWAIGKFPQFKLVIYAEVRRLKSHKKAEDLVINAVENLKKSGGAIKKAIKLLFRSNTKELLVLLDGYDEQQANAPVLEELREIFSSNGPVPDLAFKLIVSARTNFLSVHQDSRFGHGEVIGFDTNKQKNNFIVKFFANTTGNPSAVEVQLTSIKHLREICTSPLYIAILCAVVDDLGKGETIRNTIELMERFTLYLLKFHAHKGDCCSCDDLLNSCGFIFTKGKCKDEIKRLDERWRNCAFLYNLGKLAFDMLTNFNSSSDGYRKEIVDFEEKDLIEHNIAKDKKFHFGFLAEVNTINKENGVLQKYRYRFNHKTFQDFYAAFYCNQSFNEIPWDQVSTEKCRVPSDFEYFLFRFALDRPSHGFSNFKRFFENHLGIELELSKGDIETGMQLHTLLKAFINLRELTLSGTLNQGNICIPDLKELRSLFFNSIHLGHENQTIQALPMSKLPKLEIIRFRGHCWQSNKEWQNFVYSIALTSQSRQLKHFEIHCTHWPAKNWSFVVEFLSELINCSPAVQKVSFYKDEQDSWPFLTLISNSSLIGSAIEKLAQANFTTIELSAHFVSYCAVDMNKFLSAKELQQDGRQLYVLDIAEHKENATLRLNLTRLGIDTEEQLTPFLIDWSTKLKHMKISGVLKVGNLTLPPMQHLQLLEISNLKLATNDQSISPFNMSEMPSLKTLRFESCEWTIAQWKTIVQSIHGLNHFIVHCTNWLQMEENARFIVEYFDVLANSNTAIEKLSLIKREQDVWPNSIIHDENRFQMLDVVQQLASNFETIEMSKEFVNFFGIEISAFHIVKEFKINNEIIYTIKRAVYKSDERKNYDSSKLNYDCESMKNATLWCISRFMNSSHLIVNGTLLTEGRTILRILLVQKIRFNNLLISRSYQLNCSHFQLKKNYKPISTRFSFHNCSWTDNQFRSNFARALKDSYHPVKLFEFGCVTSSKIDYLMQKFELAININGFYVFELQFGESLFNAVGSDCKIPPDQINSADVPLRVKNVTSNVGIQSSLTQFVLKKKAQQKFLVEVDSSEQYGQSSTTRIYLGITKNIFASGNKIALHLRKSPAANVSHLTISGELVSGNLILPPLFHLKTLIFDNFMFTNDDQMLELEPYSQELMPKLEIVHYESCPYSREFRSDIEPNMRSLLSLCHLNLTMLRIRCPDWSMKVWRFIEKFYADLRKCSGTINALYLLKLPDDNWPNKSEKILPTDFTYIVEYLVRQSNFKKVIINKEFASFCDISNKLLNNATRRRMDGEEVFIFERRYYTSKVTL